MVWHVSVHTWNLEDNFLKSVLSLTQDRTQVIKLHGRCFYAMSCLTSPTLFTYNKCLLPYAGSRILTSKRMSKSWGRRCNSRGINNWLASVRPWVWLPALHTHTNQNLHVTCTLIILGCLILRFWAGFFFFFETRSFAKKIFCKDGSVVKSADACVWTLELSTLVFETGGLTDLEFTDLAHLARQQVQGSTCHSLLSAEIKAHTTIPGFSFFRQGFFL